jgi:purine-cytosine permease-like protein
MGASLFTASSDIAAIMVKAGLGIVGLVIIILSTVTTTFLDAYSGGVSCESIWGRIPGKWAAIVIAAIGTVAAIVYPMDDITSFLYLIGSVFAPMIAIQIADYFILKSNGELNKFKWSNLAVWVVGFVAYRYLMTVDTPMGNTLPDMLITMVLCIVVNCIINAVRKEKVAK